MYVSVRGRQYEEEVPIPPGGRVLHLEGHVYTSDESHLFSKFCVCNFMLAWRVWLAFKDVSFLPGHFCGRTVQSSRGGAY